MRFDRSQVVRRGQYRHRPNAGHTVQNRRTGSLEVSKLRVCFDLNPHHTVIAVVFGFRIGGTRLQRCGSEKEHRKRIPKPT